jgi:hypothetical protein
MDVLVAHLMVCDTYGDRISFSRRMCCPEGYINSLLQPLFPLVSIALAPGHDIVKFLCSILESSLWG